MFLQCIARPSLFFKALFRRIPASQYYYRTGCLCPLAAERAVSSYPPCTQSPVSQLLSQCRGVLCGVPVCLFVFADANKRLSRRGKHDSFSESRTAAPYESRRAFVTAFTALMRASSTAPFGMPSCSSALPTPAASNQASRIPAFICNTEFPSNSFNFAHTNKRPSRRGKHLSPRIQNSRSI